MKIKLILISIIFLLSTNFLIASANYFEEGLILFKKNQLKKAKFKFEQDIVQNPKSEKSYLYLAKIFNNEEKFELAENNLNTVILLNPKNEDAIYDLALLMLNKSNYSEAEKLIKNLKEVCKNLCKKPNELNAKLKNLLKK